MTETTVTTATPVTLKRAAARLHAARDRVESLSNTWSALLDMLRDALRWAYANRKALMLDGRAFERIAKEERIDFVAVVETPTITLPSDSAKLLGEG